MKSSKPKFETLQFPWDRQAGEIFRTASKSISDELDFESYMDWLEEFKPNPTKLRQAKIYHQMFTLSQ
jgi:hypothetical protein